MEPLELPQPGKLVQELLVGPVRGGSCALLRRHNPGHPIVTHGVGVFELCAVPGDVPLLKLDVRERNVVLVCYGVIPIQYTLAYMGMTTLFLAFIPVLMFVFIPFLLW